MGELVDLGRLVQLRRRWQEAGLTMVFTNGCFDLIHLGHIHYLRRARSLGDLLVVGLNSDASTHRLKGPKRPLLPQEDRGGLLAALEMVDYVVIFEEDTAEGLVETLKPDVYVKGGDYGPGGKALPEAKIVTGYGGQVNIIPLMSGRSSSAVIDSILERYRTGET